MVFTLIHISISFLIFYILRSRLRIELFAFLLAAVLPDIESIYYGLQAFGVCGYNDFVCLAEYPSHYFMHSFLGIMAAGVFAAFAAKKLRMNFRLKEYGMKVLYTSALFGGLTHLMVDSSVHKGADSLAFFWPVDMRFSFIFAGAQLLWNSTALIGIVLFLYLLNKNKLGKMLK